MKVIAFFPHSLQLSWFDGSWTFDLVYLHLELGHWKIKKKHFISSKLSFRFIHSKTPNCANSSVVCSCKCMCSPLFTSIVSCRRNPPLRTRESRACAPPTQMCQIILAVILCKHQLFFVIVRWRLNGFYRLIRNKRRILSICRLSACNQ